MKERKLSKKKSRQILATVVMGMNLVNSMAPMAAAVQKLPAEGELQVKPKSEAKPLEYTVLPQTLNVVESLVFGKAEAGPTGPTTSSNVMESGDRMNISGGETGIVGTMNGGDQWIYTDATGIVDTMSGGSQWVAVGATGTVSTMSNGVQMVLSRGSGTVNAMSGGTQNVDNGTGTVDTMNGGTQLISGEIGSGTVSTMMSGGQQHISSGGTGIVETMSGGRQRISSGGSGTVSTMNGGQQHISSGGIGSVNVMYLGGSQIVSGGTGTVNIMNGKQNIYDGGTGSADTMYDNGVQTIFDGTGKVDNMSGGNQSIDKGVGIISTMHNGNQLIFARQTGSVNIMINGMQRIESSGIGTVDTMNGGIQYVQGSGLVSTMYGGSQFIYNDSGKSGAIGTIKIMNGGYQYILARIGSVGIMNTGNQRITAGGTGIVDDMLGGTQSILNTGIGTISTMNGGIQEVQAGGTALDTKIYGGTQLIGGSAVNTTISGGVAVMQGDSAFVSGLTMSGGEYLLGADGGSSYNIRGNFEFTGGSLDMTKNTSGTQTGTHEKLTIDNLDKAGGTFIMDTDLNNEKGDKITISNANAGTSYIQVNDASLLNGTVTDHKNLLLITDNSGKLTFEGKEINKGGLWTATAAIENGANVTDAHGNVIGQSNEWYLTHVVRAVNNDTEVLLDGTDNSYALWRNTNDTLRKRLGELHYRTNETDSDGIWARYTGGKFAGGGFDSSYNMYQLGYDKADNAKSIYGFALESGTGHADYSFGSGKDKLFAGSIYGTWTGDDGSYTDVVAKIGQFDTDIESYGDYPDKASYKNRAYSVSVEYGKTIELSEKRGTFIEPQLQFIAGRLSSSEYTTDRGNNVYVGGLNSYIGRIGFTLGQEMPDGNNVYFKASALHEFGGSRDLHMTAANGETLSMSKDYSDTWFEVGIGTNIKLSKASYFYGDIERSFGGEIEKKWQVNAGVRFEF